MFWVYFHKHFGNKNVSVLYIPSEFLGRFDWHYFLYDEEGLVHDGAKNVFEAVRKAKKRNLFISRVWD